MPQAEICFLLTSGHFTNWLQKVKCSFEFTKKSDDFLSPTALCTRVLQEGQIKHIRFTGSIQHTYR